MDKPRVMEATKAEGRWGTLGQVLNIAIGPLFLVFCINVALRIADVLR